MELIIGFYVISICVMIGLVYREKREEILTDLFGQWHRQNRNPTIHHDPVLAYNYGREPHDSYSQVFPSFGVIGVIADQIVFVGRGEKHGSSIDLNQLRWIGAYDISAMRNGTIDQKKALILHYEDQYRWRVSAFVIDREKVLNSLLRVIETQTGLVPQYSRQDFGPHPAQRMGQDIYGQWQVALTHGENWNQSPRSSVLGVVKLVYQLYLAPDRLRYNGYTVMHLSQIRHVDLYEKSGLHKFNPFSEDMLRIEYEQDGKYRVAGFLVRSGRAWAEALQARLNLPVEVHEGRKKKEG